MDFGPFILWILGAVAAIILLPIVVICAITRSKSARPLAFVLLGLLVFLIAGGWFIRGEFILGEEMVIAAGSGDLRSVRDLLDSGAFINATFEGKTALQAAKEGSHTDIVALLKQRGAR